MYIKICTQNYLFICMEIIHKQLVSLYAYIYLLVFSTSCRNMEVEEQVRFYPSDERSGVSKLTDHVWMNRIMMTCEWIDWRTEDRLANTKMWVIKVETVNGLKTCWLHVNGLLISHQLLTSVEKFQSSSENKQMLLAMDGMYRCTSFCVKRLQNCDVPVDRD